MDKRFKPLTPIQQMQKRLSVLETVSNNPDWPFHQVARFIRTELHLTLNDMAKITKVAPQTLQKMEQPEGNPTLKSMQKLLDAFGLKLEIRVKS
jgi:DNA-binding XRE family transcriptional regulator